MPMNQKVRWEIPVKNRQGMKNLLHILDPFASKASSYVWMLGRLGGPRTRNRVLLVGQLKGVLTHQAIEMFLQESLAEM